MVKPTSSPSKKSGAPKKVKIPVRTPFDDRGELKSLREDPLQYIFETKNKSPGAMGGEKGFDMTPEQQKNFKQSVIKKKDGGLMEAIRKVDAEKEKRLKDGGMIGNLTSNFKGFY